MPLGARVPARNSKPWEFDDSLPDPEQATWAKISITVERKGGGVVDAELIRPLDWIESNGIEGGHQLPLNIADLQVVGLAYVTSVEPCPEIASGDGSVITGRFITRQVDRIARIKILGADGKVESIEGTPIHPVWSEDRQDWLPLGELTEGEQLRGDTGTAIVLAATILLRPTPVYNIEVHGEHVYQVGELGVVVHNACSSTSGHSSAAAIGQQMHKAYMAGIANGSTLFKEYILKSGKRVDFLDTAKGIVYELKPNNPKAIARGVRQAQNYIAELASDFKFAHIKNWLIKIDVY